jgi:SAM-dependent methyltransferase
MIFYEEKWWDDIYKMEDRAWGYEPAECLKEWIKEFPVNATVLDLGCGSGRNANYLAQHGFKVYGYDWSEEAIQQAKNISSDANYYVKDMMLENWGSTQYDVVIDFGYFHFFMPESRPHYHEQLKRVLKPGGIYVNESGRDSVDMPMDININHLDFLPPSLKKEAWDEFDYLNIEKLEDKILPPQGNFSQYPCWNIFARKL